MNFLSNQEIKTSTKWNFRSICYQKKLQIENGVVGGDIRVTYASIPICFLNIHSEKNKFNKKTR